MIIHITEEGWRRVCSGCHRPGLLHHSADGTLWCDECIALRGRAKRRKSVAKRQVTVNRDQQHM